MLVASAVTLTPLVRTLAASFNGPGNSTGDESCRGCFFLFGTLFWEGVDIRTKEGKCDFPLVWSQDFCEDFFDRHDRAIVSTSSTSSTIDPLGNKTRR